MVTLTVFIDPPLTGFVGELHYWAAEQWWYQIQLPASADGVISVGLGTVDPSLVWKVHFPRQTVDGVTYRPNDSGQFTLQGDITTNVTLVPEAGPPPGPGARTPWAALPPIAAALAFMYWRR